MPSSSGFFGSSNFTAADVRPATVEQLTNVSIPVKVGIRSVNVNATLRLGSLRAA